MIFVFPGSGGIAQRFALAAQLNLALSQLGQEGAAAAFANQLIDVGNHVHWKDDVGSSVQILRHTYSVTYPCAQHKVIQRISWLMVENETNPELP